MVKAALANMSHVIADCLPEDKMNTVSTLQQEGHVVAMVGTLHYYCLGNIKLILTKTEIHM